MTQLINRQPCRVARAEEVGDDPNVFGCVIFLPGGGAKSIATRTQDTEYLAPQLAKDYVTAVVDSLLKDRNEADIREVNWVSVISAVQYLIVEWNRAKRDRLERDAMLDKIAQLPNPETTH